MPLLGFESTSFSHQPESIDYNMKCWLWLVHFVSFICTMFSYCFFPIYDVCLWGAGHCKYRALRGCEWSWDEGIYGIWVWEAFVAVWCIETSLGLLCLIISWPYLLEFKPSFWSQMIVEMGSKVLWSQYMKA